MASANAKLKNLPMSPRKVRLVADMIRGEKVASARDTLQFTPKASALPLLKLLNSAVANAENAAADRDDRVDSEEMVIARIVVNDGITRRKYQPAPRGRATRLRNRHCHVELTIADK